MTEDKAPDVNAQTKTETPELLNMTQKELNEMLGRVRTETRSQSEKEITRLKADYEEISKLAAMYGTERVRRYISELSPSHSDTGIPRSGSLPRDRP